MKDYFRYQSKLKQKLYSIKYIYRILKQINLSLVFLDIIKLSISIKFTLKKLSNNIFTGFSH